jgi:hypothetical protein
MDLPGVDEENGGNAVMDHLMILLYLNEFELSLYRKLEILMDLIQ